MDNIEKINRLYEIKAYLDEVRRMIYKNREVLNEYKNDILLRRFDIDMTEEAEKALKSYFTKVIYEELALLASQEDKAVKKFNADILELTKTEE
jgi:hypothetical protein